MLHNNLSVSVHFLFLYTPSEAWGQTWVKLSTQVHQLLPGEADCTTQHKYTAESTQVSKFFLFFGSQSCRETSSVYCETGESWNSPKSSRSVWICVSISGGWSQHVQLPLKISMEPTSTETTSNLQAPGLFLRAPCSSPLSLSQRFFSILSCRPCLTLTDNDGDVWTGGVKGSAALSPLLQSITRCRLPMTAITFL